MLPLVLRRAAPVNDAPRPSAASAADSVGAFLSWCLCIHPVSLPDQSARQPQQVAQQRAAQGLSSLHCRGVRESV